MDAQPIALWAQLLGLLYVATGVFRFFCHLPQARRCYGSADRAAGVSLSTWFGLLACASVAFLYAVLVVRDIPLMISTGANVLGPVLVILGVLRARHAEKPAVADPEPIAATAAGHG
jgi:hypothetical protein